MPHNRYHSRYHCVYSKIWSIFATVPLIAFLVLWIVSGKSIYAQQVTHDFDLHNTPTARESPAELPRRPFHLETRAPSHWELTLTQQHGPFIGVVYCPVPPDDPCQTIKEVEMYAETQRGRIYAEKAVDLGPLRKPLLKLKLSARRPFRLIVHVVVSFHNTELKPGAPAKQPKPLDEVRLKEYLHTGWPTKQAREWFHKWMTTHELIRKQGEDDSAFAYRVLKFMQDHFRYVIPDDIPAHKALVKKNPVMGDWYYTIRTHTGECWRLSDTYCRIMRMNHIPARLVSGNMVTANSNKTGHHLRSLIYLQDVGWIPIEATAAISLQKRPPVGFFGSWGGAMLIGNENINFVLKGPKGKWQVGTLDGVIYGSSTGDWEYPDVTFYARRAPLRQAI